MNDPTKTELVFEDLEQAYFDIIQFRRYPRRFRMAFEIYIYKSQQLTEAMRSEYKLRTRKKWNASAFQGWNYYSTAIKKIRNAILHGNPLQLEETVLSVYPLYPEVEHRKPLRKRYVEKVYFAMRGHTLVSMPFKEEFVSTNNGIPLIRKVVDDPRDKRNFLFPVKEFVGYYLQWDLLDSNTMRELDSESTIDAVRLALKSYPVYEKYMKYYKIELDSNLPEWAKSKKEDEGQKKDQMEGLEISNEKGFYVGGSFIPMLKQ